MSEEKKPEVTTEQNVNMEAALDPDYKAWQQRKKTQARLAEMVEKDPDFKDVLETTVDGKTYREEILDKPRILDDDDLFVAKTRIYSKERIEQLKKAEREQGQQKKVEDAPPPASSANDEGHRAGPRENVVAKGNEGKWTPSDLTDDELKKKGFTEKDIAMLRTF